MNFNAHENDVNTILMQMKNSLWMIMMWWDMLCAYNTIKWLHIAINMSNKIHNKDKSNMVIRE